MRLLRAAQVRVANYLMLQASVRLEKAAKFTLIGVKDQKIAS